MLPLIASSAESLQFQCQGNRYCKFIAILSLNTVYGQQRETYLNLSIRALLYKKIARYWHFKQVFQAEYATT